MKQESIKYLLLFFQLFAVSAEAIYFAKTFSPDDGRADNLGEARSQFVYRDGQMGGKPVDYLRFFEDVQRQREYFDKPEKILGNVRQRVG